MSRLSFLILVSLSTLVSGNDQFWLTTVITDFKVRDRCAVFWNQSQACPAPLLRISTDINRPTQFASRAWPLKDVHNSTEKPSFISQWHGSIESIRVAAQIEGSNPLNPFGLIAKCDQGFHPKVIFNQSSINVMERLSTRVIVINSQCFTAKILLKVDTECPYCPPPTTTAAPTTAALESFIFTHRILIIACLFFALLATFCIIVFVITLRRFHKHRNGFKTCPSLESGISTITPHTNSTFIDDVKPTPVVDFFTLMPPLIDEEEFDLDESINIEAMPRLGSLVYDYFSMESKMNVSISDPVYV